MPRPTQHTVNRQAHRSIDRPHPSPLLLANAKSRSIGRPIDQSLSHLPFGSIDRSSVVFDVTRYSNRSIDRSIDRLIVRSTPQLVCGSNACGRTCSPQLIRSCFPLLRGLRKGRVDSALPFSLDFGRACLPASIRHTHSRSMRRAPNAGDLTHDGPLLGGQLRDLSGAARFDKGRRGAQPLLLSYPHVLSSPVVAELFVLHSLGCGRV